MLHVNDTSRFHQKNVGFSVASYLNISLLKIGIFLEMGSGMQRAPQNMSYKLVPRVLSWNPGIEVVCPTLVKPIPYTANGQSCS